MRWQSERILWVAKGYKVKCLLTSLCSRATLLENCMPGKMSNGISLPKIFLANTTF